MFDAILFSLNNSFSTAAMFARRKHKTPQSENKQKQGRRKVENTNWREEMPPEGMKNEFSVGRMFRCLSVFQCPKHRSTKNVPPYTVMNSWKDIFLTHITLILDFRRRFGNGRIRENNLNMQRLKRKSFSELTYFDLFLLFVGMSYRIWILRFLAEKKDV